MQAQRPISIAVDCLGRSKPRYGLQSECRVHADAERPPETRSRYRNHANALVHGWCFRGSANSSFSSNSAVSSGSPPAADTAAFVEGRRSAPALSLLVRGGCLVLPVGRRPPSQVDGTLATPLAPLLRSHRATAPLVAPVWIIRDRAQPPARPPTPSTVE